MYNYFQSLIKNHYFQNNNPFKYTIPHLRDPGNEVGETIHSIPQNQDSGSQGNGFSSQLSPLRFRINRARNKRDITNPKERCMSALNDGVTVDH